MKTTELRGLALLDAVIAHIEAHPETWRQDFYRCETGMCVAGWAAEMTGGKWVTRPGDDLGHMLAPEPDDPDHDVDTFDGLRGVSASMRAARLLGIDDDQALSLFSGGNRLEDIRRIRDELAAGGLA